MCRITTWRLWLKEFHFYLIATEKDNKDDKIETSMLLTCIGQIYDTFTFDLADDERKLEPALYKFSEYCNLTKKGTRKRSEEKCHHSPG